MMKSLPKFWLMILLPLFFGSNCSSQDKSGEAGLVDRQPAVAGQFYSSNPVQLKADLSVLFSQAVPMKSENVRAIICPHA